MSAEDEAVREYLRLHPAQETALWMDWVAVACRSAKIAPPTGREWDVLMKAWHHGKQPLSSVYELRAMRDERTT